MNLILTCKCGEKFKIGFDRAGQEVFCPGCGKKSKVPTPKARPRPSPPKPAAPPEEEEIKLKDLPPPTVTEVVEEEVEGGYNLDAKDGLKDLAVGVGMYGTVAVIQLPAPAQCIAFGCKGDWALANQGNDVMVLDMENNCKFGVYE
jgi:hypothetical protein